jgi:hypothetical protein
MPTKRLLRLIHKVLTPSALMFASNGSTKKLLPPTSVSETTDPQELSVSKLEIVELLLSYGTDATLCNWIGLTAVDIAGDTGQKDVFDLLTARIKTKSAARNRRTESTSNVKGVSSTNAASLMASLNSSGDDELSNSADKKVQKQDVLIIRIGLGGWSRGRSIAE